MVRMILAIVVGIAATVAVIIAMEAIGHAIFPVQPVPPGSGATAVTPVALHLVVVAGYLIGTLIGGWIAVSIARRDAASWIVGVVFAAGGVANALTVPQPVWTQLAAVLAPLVGAALALHLPRLGRAGRTV